MAYFGIICQIKILSYKDYEIGAVYSLGKLMQGNPWNLLNHTREPAFSKWSDVLFRLPKNVIIWVFTFLNIFVLITAFSLVDHLNGESGERRRLKIQRACMVIGVLFFLFASV